MDWKAKQPDALNLQRDDHPEREHLLVIRMDSAHWGEWIRTLTELLSDPNPSAELKSEWPGGWTIYWKNRDDDSRVLLAHPDENLWVATIAWKRDAAGSLLEALLRLSPGERLSLLEFEGVSFLSNLEICFERLQG